MVDSVGNGAMAYGAFSASGGYLEVQIKGAITRFVGSANQDSLRAAQVRVRHETISRGKCRLVVAGDIYPCKTAGGRDIISKNSS